MRTTAYDLADSLVQSGVIDASEHEEATAVLHYHLIDTGDYPSEGCAVESDTITQAAPGDPD